MMKVTQGKTAWVNRRLCWSRKRMGSKQKSKMANPALTYRYVFSVKTVNCGAKVSKKNTAAFKGARKDAIKGGSPICSLGGIFFTNRPIAVRLNSHHATLCLADQSFWGRRANP